MLAAPPLAAPPLAAPGAPSSPFDFNPPRGSQGNHLQGEDEHAPKAAPSLTLAGADYSGSGDEHEGIRRVLAGNTSLTTWDCVRIPPPTTEITSALMA